ncbi:PQQ-dependent sugar dehydrogenase [Aquimarina agarilytica]|uniref:PQQ-dependent sugar dehydrogenase n=1 Tax=Aquimarina agarilytica TaxID=1087449 RepID=UPI000289E840|nr:PQQ-dependent sugar dehydrogenase [Aquimarina agarilytica]
MKTFLYHLIYVGIICSFTTLKAQITFEPAFPNVSFNFPVEIANPGDGTDRLFVVEQSGKIKVFPRKKSLQPNEVSTFIDLSSDIFFRSGLELGLLGLAFHPNYKNNGYFYIYYTDAAQGRNPRMVVSRFTVSNSNPNLADPNSEFIIFQFDKNQSNSNHNGGKIAFGPDGYLYISIGDGGGGNDPQRNAQNINNVFGSICRIDVDMDGNNAIETNSALPNGRYEIPADNPFANSNGLDEIYVYGIRNTWKFSFDAPTGRLWGADVGQSAFEEINLIQNGKNYGWNRFEAQDFANNTPLNGSVKEDPVLFYDHLNGDVSITGGYVYRGTQIKSTTPDINSKYIFGDYVSGRVWAMDYDPSINRATKTLLFKTNGQFISSFGVDKNGELYFSSYGNEAQLFQLVDGAAAPIGNQLSGEGDWSNLGNGIPNGEVNTIVETSNGDIFHGGNFTLAGNITANNLAVYNENTGWKTFGTGANGTINDIKVDSNGLVYVAGTFTDINGLPANAIAVWDGIEWKTLGNGNEIEGIIQAITIDATNQIYVGGVFENVSGNLAQNIAKWDGSTWNILTDNTTNESGTNNEIRSLATDPVTNNIYVGGNFDVAGGVSANRIAVWNDTTKKWSNLGTGTSGFVEAIEVTTTDVFAGGNFAIAGGQTVNRLTRWNKANNTWNALDSGVDNLVKSLKYDGSDLYVGGAFRLAAFTKNNFIVNGIAKWNSANGWQSLGQGNNVGVNNKVNSIALDKNSIGKIYTAGNFSVAGNNNANNTATWSSDSVLSLNDINTSIEKTFIVKNPINKVISIKEAAPWKLYDSIGKFLTAGYSKTINLGTYPSGLYFLILNNDKTLKIIKQ